MRTKIRLLLCSLIWAYTILANMQSTSSVFPVKMLAKLEWTQSNSHKNKEQLQNPTMGVTTTTSQQQQNHNFRTDSSQRHGGGGGGGKCILIGTKFSPQILLLLKHKNVSSHGGFLTIAMYHLGEIILNKTNTL